MESELHLGEDAGALGRIGSHLRQLVDAVVRDELAVDSAGQDDRAKFGIGLGLANQLEQLAGPRPDEIIHRRIAVGPYLDVIVALDDPVFHGPPPRRWPSLRALRLSRRLRVQ